MEAWLLRVVISATAVQPELHIVLGCLNANNLFPGHEPRFHHVPVTTSSVQMSSHSEV
jgi:hypothetical protein